MSGHGDEDGRHDDFVERQVGIAGEETQQIVAGGCTRRSAAVGRNWAISLAEAVAPAAISSGSARVPSMRMMTGETSRSRWAPRHRGPATR